MLALLFISFQIKRCTNLCWLADDLNVQLEEIVSNFEITLTNEFSALLDECPSLIDVLCLIKYLKRRCLSVLNID